MFGIREEYSNRWDMKPLSSVCDVLYGYPFDSNLFNDVGNGIPLIRVRDINSGFSGTYTTEIVDEKYVVENGDILISMDGDFCAKQWSCGKALLNQRTCKIINHENIINRIFLLHYLNPELEWIHDHTSSTTVKHLSAKDLNKLLVPLPPTDKQESFSSFVEIVDKIKRSMKHCLEQYDILIKSRFIEMFGNPFVNNLNWPIDSLSNHIVNANNGMTRRGNDENGMIVLRLVELQKGYIDYSEPNRILPNEKEFTKFTVNKGDFLFARVNGNPDNVGRCAVFNGFNEPVLFNDHIIRIKFDNKIGSAYLLMILNDNCGRIQLKNKIKTSAGQYTVSQDGIGSIVIPLPPIDLQNQFAAFVEQIDKSKFVETVEPDHPAVFQNVHGFPSFGLIST